VVRHQYARDHPRVICGLAVGRRDAEKALHGRPAGTFLVRIASEGNGLVLSCVVAGAQPAVEHVHMSLEQLGLVPLEEALGIIPRAQQLLDLGSGRLHGLDAVMQRGYMHDVPLLELARKRKLAATAPGAASGRSEGGMPCTPCDVALLGSIDTASAQTGALLGIAGNPPLVPSLCALGVPALHARALPRPPPMPMPMPMPLPSAAAAATPAGGAVPQPLFPGWCLMPGHTPPPAPCSSSGGASFGVVPLAG
jgi:hypothetical protein